MNVFGAWLIAPATLALALVACGGEAPPPETPAPPPEAPAAPPPEPAAANPPPAADTGPAPAPAPPPAPPLTDEQIAAITVAADSGEIDQAKMAQGKAKDAKVKKFAQQMIQHHGEAKKKAEGIVKKAKITPAESDTSKQISSESQKLLDSWKDLKGPDFDKSYMDAQVKEHSMVLDVIDKQILPAVKNPDLKAAVEAFRPKVEAHLKDAKDIQAALAAAPAPAAGGPGASGAAPGGGPAKKP
jgi:putative membrane protein